MVGATVGRHGFPFHGLQTNLFGSRDAFKEIHIVKQMTDLHKGPASLAKSGVLATAHSQFKFSGAVISGLPQPPPAWPLLHLLTFQSQGWVRKDPQATRALLGFPAPGQQLVPISRELTPLEEASLQNQKLKAAYEARMARLDPSQAVQKTSLVSGTPEAVLVGEAAGLTPAFLS